MIIVNSPNEKPPVRLPEVLGRLAWGKITFGPTNLSRILENITGEAESLAQRGGGLLCLPYVTENEASARLLMSALLGRLKTLKKSSFLYIPQVAPDFDPAILSYQYLLIHNLPQCGALLDLLAERKARGKRVERVVIATGVYEQWERLQSSLPQRFYPALPPNGDATAEMVEQSVREELREYAEFTAGLEPGEGCDAEIFGHAYLFVCLFDACSIPIPFALLARALKTDEDRLGEMIAAAEERQLLHWIEVERPPALLVSSKSPVIARHIVGKLLRAQVEQQTKPRAVIERILDESAKIIHAVNTQEKEERYTVLNYLQSWLLGVRPWPHTLKNGTNSRRGTILTLLERASESIERIWINGDEMEALLWGKVFEELRLFDLSDKVFQYGLNQARHRQTNIYLLQARARMLGLWSRTQPPDHGGIYQRARKAFGEALNVASSPHVWQALGVMEAEHGNVIDAREAFKRAASVALGDEKVYTLVAWANMELEVGNYAAAEDKLQRAGDPPFNAYVPHVWARLYFYEGHYEAAADSLNRLWQVDPLSVKGWNLSGEIAAKRGHWHHAREAFSKVLVVDDENSYALRALGEFHGRLASLAAKLQQEELAASQFGRAEKYFTRALTCEGENPQSRVSYGVMLGQRSLFERKLGRAEAAQQFFQQAEAQFENVIRDYGENKFALHGFGALLVNWHRSEEARAKFLVILDKLDGRNLPALLSLATLEVEQGEKDAARKRLGEVKEILEAAAGHEKALPRHEIIRSYNSWADVELSLGDTEKALELLEYSGSNLDPNNAYTHRALAKVLLQLGKPAEAQGHEQRAIELGMRLDL